MKRLKILGIVVFLGLIISSIGQADPPGGKDVNIVNPLPLPVTGEITSTVTGDVNITNTDPIPVNVENSEPIAVDIGDSLSAAF